jgi:hypothetical protein
MCFRLHCPKEVATGAFIFYIILFSVFLCAIFLNFMLMNVNFRAIYLIGLIQIWGAEFLGTDGNRKHMSF